MLVVVRVWLPDRPGALGQVASRIGAVRGDLVAIDILESGDGRAIDEFVVSLDEPRLIDLMVAEVNDVDGVSVEDVRVIDDDRSPSELIVLGAAVELAEADPHAVIGVLCEAVMRSVDADWCVIAEAGVVIESRGSVPEQISDEPDGRPTDSIEPRATIEARLERCRLDVVAGRSGRPIHERERVRMALLARLADSLIRPTSS